MNLTKEQIERRINSSTNIVNILDQTRAQLEVEYKDGINNHSGSRGSKHLTPEERIAIGVIASITDSNTAAEIFGIHPSHANDLKNGNRNVGTGTHAESLRVRDEGLKLAIGARLEATKLTIQERAANKLLSAIGLISEEKLENASLKDIATISNSMSQVVRNLTSQSQDTNNGKPNVKIIVHQPRPSREESFDCIEISV